MVNNNDTEQYNKFIENLDLSKDCYNTETKQFNTFDPNSSFDNQ